MPSLKFPVILHFVKGMVPTQEDIAETADYGHDVQFRNAFLLPKKMSEGGIEACDGVSGAVPPDYAALFPHAKDVIERHKLKYTRPAEAHALPPLKTLAASLRSDGSSAPALKVPGVAVNSESPADGISLALPLEVSEALSDPKKVWSGSPRQRKE